MARGAGKTANDITSLLKGMTGTSDDFHKQSLWKLMVCGGHFTREDHSNTRETSTTEARERDL